jgi:hypothetical protein
MAGAAFHFSRADSMRGEQRYMSNQESDQFGTAERDLRAAINLLRHGVEELEADIQSIRDGPMDDDVRKSIRRLHDAVGLFIKERQRFEEQFAKMGGHAGRDFLDLGAARAEIERRMDRLRRARDT